MARSFAEPFLGGLHSEVEASRAEVREAFGVLSPGQLGWSPGEGAWGVAQCLDHLVTTDRLYLEEFERVVARGRRDGKLRPGTFRGGWFGAWFARILGPNVKTPSRLSGLPAHPLPPG